MQQMRASTRFSTALAIILGVTIPFASLPAIAAPVELDLDLLEAAERAEARRIALIEDIAPAVVCIFDEGQHGGGSGVIIDEAGYGLTNFHVVASMLETRRGLGGLSDGQLYDLQVLGIDPGGDVAMFKLSGRERFPHVRLGDSDALKVGDRVLAMGNPFVLSEDYAPTVTMGIVSGVHRYQMGSGDTLLYSDCIQVDASINPGNSGGPLFNVDGEVIGINGRISVSLRGRVNVGLGYAITSNQIKPFLPALRAGLAVEHGTMQAIARDHGDGSVIFTELLEDGPAWNIGIRPGDRLVRFAGRDIQSANHFASVLGTLPADWPVAVSYRKADGPVVHREARTEPIKLAEIEEFKPDADVNRLAVERVLKKFRESVGFDRIRMATPRVWHWTQRHIVEGEAEPTVVYDFSDPPSGPITLRPHSGRDPKIRIEAEGTTYLYPSGPQPAPMDSDLLYRALFHLNRTVLSDPLFGDETFWRHRGGDSLLDIDADGNVASTLLECIALSTGDNAEMRFQFDAESGALRRIVAVDTPTGTEVRLLFEKATPWESTIKVNAPSGNFTIVRTDVRPPWVLAGDTDRSAASEGKSEGRDSRNRQRADDISETELLHETVQMLTDRVVKLIGAKAGRVSGFGSGIIISPDGLVLTVESILLDARNLRAFLSDGSQRSVEVVYADRDSHLALLRMKPDTHTIPAEREFDEGWPAKAEEGDGEPRMGEATEAAVESGAAGAAELPYFELEGDVELAPGQWLLAGGNPFKVAAGGEPISAALGVYSGTSKLDATRGTQDFPYHGQVLVIDAVTSTPGFPGGAVVDLQGRLVGMVGRVVESRATHTMLNYAIPREVLSRFVSAARDPESRAKLSETPVTGSSKPVYHGLKFFELGYRSNPVYVERVKRGSPAARAGARRDDLVIGANGKPVPKLEDLERILEACRPGDTLELTLMRGEKIVKVSIVLEEEE